MTANTRQMRKRSWYIPYFRPIAERSPMTRAECTEGIFPDQSMPFRVHFPPIACTIHFTSMAVSSAINGTPSTCIWKYVCIDSSIVRLNANINDYLTRKIQHTIHLLSYCITHEWWWWNRHLIHRIFRREHVKNVNPDNELWQNIETILFLLSCIRGCLLEMWPSPLLLTFSLWVHDQAVIHYWSYSRKYQLPVIIQ